MPRKFLKRYAPSSSEIKSNPGLRFLGPLLEDPNLFHLNRYSVSMAFLVGVFLAFIPLPGQMAIAAVIALWVRCNLPIAVALVWITNPVTIAPIFFSTYKLGLWLLDVPDPEQTVRIMSWETLQNLTRLSTLKPLLIGSLCAGSFFSLLSYFSIRYLWRFYVVYQWNHRREKRARRKR